MSATRVSFLGASPDAVLRSPACKGQSEATPPQSISTPDHAFYSSSKRQSRSCGVIHKLSCRRTAVRSCHPQDQQNRLLQNGSWAADNNLTFGQALKRSVCSLGVALSVHLPSTSTALALDSDILGGANNIIRDLEGFDWAGWADWHESPLATGVVNIWTQWTAALVSTAQPFELHSGETSSSVLFYLSVVLLLLGLTAQPRQ